MRLRKYESALNSIDLCVSNKALNGKYWRILIDSKWYAFLKKKHSK